MSSAEESIIAAERTIDQNLPKGWVKEFIEPPWRGEPPKCRGCGRDPQMSAIAAPQLKWANVAILRHDQAKKTLLYSFGLCCENCGRDKKVMNRLALEVFAPLAPENVRLGPGDTPAGRGKLPM